MICTRGGWCSGQSFAPARDILRTREDDTASALGQSIMTVHACSFTYDNHTMSGKSSRIDYDILCCSLSRSHIPFRPSSLFRSCICFGKAFIKETASYLVILSRES